MRHADAFFGDKVTYRAWYPIIHVSDYLVDELVTCHVTLFYEFHVMLTKRFGTH